MRPNNPHAGDASVAGLGVVRVERVAGSEQVPARPREIADDPRLNPFTRAAF